MWYGVVWYGAVWCGVVWSGMVWCDVEWSGVFVVVWCGHSLNSVRAMAK